MAISSSVPMPTGRAVAQTMVSPPVPAQGFQDDISSLGPDAGWFCNVYIDYNCNNDQSSLRVDNPGIASLGWGNDAFSSLQCFRT
ncbi:hypothetical protein EW026_g709 [Hermanssonia centrifuga]|uniref:Uncharacterized protein n=1 Tax=Hermanssonia centrifuga TaxID=98765 RepID=A0A4S4KTU9_9APHY|nr:hypothetical protein EW026_g709 [Hermanssonia centrifuga]